MFGYIWQMTKKITMIIGVFLLLLVGVELFRAFVFFYRLGPVFAASYVFVLLLFAWWAIAGFAHYWFAHPKALTPPPLPESMISANARDLIAYCRYLEAYLQRLMDNPNLSEAAAQRASSAIDGIRDVLRSHPLRDDLLREIETVEQESIPALLEELEALAGAEVRKSVRDVMVGVSLSPYHSIDVFVVLYRNASMVLRIASIYATRPVPRDQFLILRDTFRVVATVNLLNAGRTLLESLFSKVPVVGKVLDDIGQGLGAGLFTSAAGHAAMERCAAFRGWDKQEAAESLARHAGTFFGDVRDIFTKDVLPGLKGRIVASTPNEVLEEPHFWERVTQGITTSVDVASHTLNTILVKPAMAGGKGVAAAGSHVTRGVVRAGGSVARATARGGRHTYRGIGRVLHTFGQRLKYTFGSRNLRK
jgi:hypothetical protein